jgi:threonine synthase
MEQVFPASCLAGLRCTSCGEAYPADEIHTTCPACGKVLFAEYDLARAARTLTPEALSSRPWMLWRYHELMPVRDPASRLTLGEGGTPLLRAERLGQALGLSRLWLKDESQNPTGSFKARGLAAAISRAKELGARAVAIPSAGNAAAAMSAYAARAGLPAYVFMPEDTPAAMPAECRAYGARVFLVRGLINDCGRVVRAGTERFGWMDVSTLKEPYRAEGKKTMGMELAEQLGWRLPDAIVYPTGGGTGIVGMWKAFDELEQIGLIGPHRPRMIVVQAEGCAPIVRAFRAGVRHANPWPEARTIAPGIRVPVAIGDYLILDAVRASGGTAVTVSDEEMVEGVRLLARQEGLFVSPEAGATVAAAQRLRERGDLGRDDEVVLFLTGSGLKHLELVEGDYPVLDPDDPELTERLAAAIGRNG